MNMNDGMSDGQILKHLILSKAARGKYISVNRTIRDLEACDDLEGREDGKGSDMKLLKAWANSKIKDDTHTTNTLSAISDTLTKLNDRMDKAGI